MHWKRISPIRKMSFCHKSLPLKLVTSHKRQVLQILNKKDEDLNTGFHVHVDDYDHGISVTSGTLACFGVQESWISDLSMSKK